MRARLAKLEGSAAALAAIKLANVGLSMLWGFAVTYVFVRMLPEKEFRAFLLLVAFNNFTISAEFGLTNIIYARLRRFWLGGETAGEGAGFRLEEIGLLFVGLGGVIGVATLIIAGALALGVIPTAHPALFLLFFLASALNVQALLAKRALAAVDANLLWEGLDLARRVISLAALIAVLGGFALMASVWVQLGTSLIAIGAAMALLHRRLGMAGRHWLAFRVGGGHARRTYLHDIGASVALTVSEIVAYNAPYFTIAAMSRDTRLLLLFDFLFKMSRAVSTAIRATIEAVLPRITRLFHAGDRAGVARGLWRANMVAMLMPACACVLLLALGQAIFAHLFAGKAALSSAELALICVVLLALGPICASVYVQGALGRFALLLRASLPFLAGSLAVMPLTVVLAPEGGEAQRLSFATLYAALFVGVAGLHIVSQRRLAREGKGL